jgi:8-oxo-dGTP pyrophosphatase MutT (NUDIX family)
MLNKFTTELQKRLQQPMPGEIAQLKMASRFRKGRILDEVDTRKARLGSVLISLYEEKGEIHTVLMKRPDYKGVHSGQVSFPGGKFEKQDKSLYETALREANEEVGIIPQEVKIIGTLSELYIPPSNFLVLPVIGQLDKKPILIPDQQEVDEILEVPLRHFFDRQKIKEKEITVAHGYRLRAPYYDIHGFTVWGATAMIIREMVDVMEEIELKPFS